ncbi:MAG: hypothetical protein ACJ706_06695 [Nitrososphaeraceae archaeon]
MTIIRDSQMGMIFPENISQRIAAFVEGKQNFPFINSNELMCIFFLYGRRWKVNSENEYKEAIDLAHHTFAKISKDITACSSNSKISMITEFARSNYINRGLQIMVDKKTEDVNGEERLFSDPAILSDCFVRHVAYYDQEFFFEVYGPFKDSDIIKDMHKYLLGRMVMIGYNRKDGKSLPFNHPLIPLYLWMAQFVD